MNSDQTAAMVRSSFPGLIGERAAMRVLTVGREQYADPEDGTQKFEQMSPHRIAEEGRQEAEDLAFYISALEHKLRHHSGQIQANVLRQAMDDLTGIHRWLETCWPQAELLQEDDSLVR